MPLTGQLWLCVAHVGNTKLLSTRQQPRGPGVSMTWLLACHHPVPEKTPKQEMTSQQKRSRCHHWVLSLPLGHTILNQNRPAWPGSTKSFIYLFIQRCTTSTYVQRLQRSSYSDTRRDLCVCVCVSDYFVSGRKKNSNSQEKKKISGGLLTLHRTPASTCPHSRKPTLKLSEANAAGIGPNCCVFASCT